MSSLKRRSLKGKKYRQFNVYEAVAGHITARGILPVPLNTPRTRDEATSSTASHPPEEVLFRHQGAPDRYEEDDFYWANRNLSPGIELPDSDLLKAVHVYAAGFYGRRGGEMDFRSLDETALMAVGVLLEEWAEVVMGLKGHEVFLEGKVKGKPDHGRADRMKGKEKDGADLEKVAEEARERRRLKRRKGRRRKRRKLEHDTEEGFTDG